MILRIWPFEMAAACLHCQLLKAPHFHHLRAFSVDLRRPAAVSAPRFPSLSKHQGHNSPVVLVGRTLSKKKFVKFADLVSRLIQ